MGAVSQAQGSVTQTDHIRYVLSALDTARRSPHGVVTLLPDILQAFPFLDAKPTDDETHEATLRQVLKDRLLLRLRERDPRKLDVRKKHRLLEVVALLAFAHKHILLDCTTGDALASKFTTDQAICDDWAALTGTSRFSIPPALVGMLGGGVIDRRPWNKRAEQGAQLVFDAAIGRPRRKPPRITLPPIPSAPTVSTELVMLPPPVWVDVAPTATLNSSLPALLKRAERLIFHGPPGAGVSTQLKLAAQHIHTQKQLGAVLVDLQQLSPGIVAEDLPALLNTAAVTPTGRFDTASKMQWIHGIESGRLVLLIDHWHVATPIQQTLLALMLKTVPRWIVASRESTDALTRLDAFAVHMPAPDPVAIAQHLLTKPLPDDLRQQAATMLFNQMPFLSRSWHGVTSVFDSVQQESPACVDVISQYFATHVRHNRLSTSHTTLLQAMSDLVFALMSSKQSLAASFSTSEALGWLRATLTLDSAQSALDDLRRCGVLASVEGMLHIDLIEVGLWAAAPRWIEAMRDKQQRNAAKRAGWYPMLRYALALPAIDEDFLDTLMWHLPTPATYALDLAEGALALTKHAQPCRWREAFLDWACRQIKHAFDHDLKQPALPISHVRWLAEISNALDREWMVKSATHLCAQVNAECAIEQNVLCRILAIVGATKQPIHLSFYECILFSNTSTAKAEALRNIAQTLLVCGDIAWLWDDLCTLFCRLSGWDQAQLIAQLLATNTEDGYRRAHWLLANAQSVCLRYFREIAALCAQLGGYLSIARAMACVRLDHLPAHPVSRQLDLALSNYALEAAAS